MRSVLIRLIPILLALLATGCGADGSDQPPIPETIWKPVGSWSGRGNQQLETFSMPRVTWRVRWEVRNVALETPGALRVTVNSADSGRTVTDVTDITDVKEPDRDVSYVTDQPHRFYLVVTSSDLDWTLTVEEPILPE